MDAPDVSSSENRTSGLNEGGLDDLLAQLAYVLEYDRRAPTTAEDEELRANQLSWQLRVSPRINVFGHSSTGKSTLLTSLGISIPRVEPEISQLNCAIHSSSFEKEFVGFTPLPFSLEPTSSGTTHQNDILEMEMGDYLQEARTWNQPRALTAHHSQPLLNITETGLCVTEYASGFDVEQWAFVAPYLCALGSEIAIFVFDASGPVDPLDNLNLLAKSLLTLDVSNRLRSIFGEHIDMHEFDFQNGHEETQRFKVHLLRTLKVQLERMRQSSLRRLELTPLDLKSAPWLQQARSRFENLFEKKIEEVVGYLRDSKVHLSVQLPGDDFDLRRDQLRRLLQLLAFSKLFGALFSFLVEELAQISETQLGFPMMAFRYIEKPLTSWIENAKLQQQRSIGMTGASATIGGVTMAAATIALSLGTPLVLAAVTGATIIGGAAGYAFGPPSFNWSGKSKEQSDSFNRQDVHDAFVLSLQDRSEHYKSLQDVILQIIGSTASRLTDHGSTSTSSDAGIELGDWIKVNTGQIDDGSGADVEE